MTDLARQLFGPEYREHDHSVFLVSDDRQDELAVEATAQGLLDHLSKER